MSRVRGVGGWWVVSEATGVLEEQTTHVPVGARMLASMAFAVCLGWSAHRGEMTQSDYARGELSAA